MAATSATMAVFGAKCLSIKSVPNKLNTTRQSLKPVSLTFSKTSPQTLPSPNPSFSFTGPAIAGVIFSSLSSCNPAFAAQQIAEIAEGDNRGIALLVPIVPAILWVLYISQPALNQVNRMINSKGIIIGLGFSGLAALHLVNTPSSMASEIFSIADASTNDNRGLLLLFVVAPAILWVLFNILQPALNQINKMRS
ncbi:hypothetical protein GIB67_027799 [Kingdonia uniflora]|uniref:Uncharacterized protein n=1 Tax=Kingdonia uniflora TaxID=39325 RepID=A0A7J7PC52_9MAGN|nr:hypothetical protein GIB67_027799 [Kingdonia uniflora]